MEKSGIGSPTGRLCAGGPERAPEPQPGKVAPEVALQAAAAEIREEPVLVVYLAPREEPVAARPGRRRDGLRETVPHGRREVEVGLVQRLDAGDLAAPDERLREGGLRIHPDAAHRGDGGRPAGVHGRDRLGDGLPGLVLAAEDEAVTEGETALPAERRGGVDVVDVEALP